MSYNAASAGITAAIIAEEQQQMTNAAIVAVSLVNKEFTAMDNQLLEGLMGQEVTVTVLNQLPVKGTITELSDNFIKLETPTKNFKNKVYVFNKNLITTILIK